MSKKKGEYVRVANRAELDLVEPLDYLILGELEDEGELVGNYYPLATTIANMRKRKFPGLASTFLAGRTRSLAAVGLAVSVNLGGDSLGWQRTKEGKEVFEAWHEQNHK